MIKNVLLIVEGGVSEVEFFGKLGSLFCGEKTKFKFYSVCTNIYSLYHKIKKYENYTDTISILKEIDAFKIQEIAGVRKWEGIYLIFDFDPQEPAYSDQTIKEMINFFSDDQEFGKLYINYPMFESFRDHSNFDLKGFLERSVAIHGLSSQAYKEYISNHGFNKRIDNFTQKHFKRICFLNLFKANYILTASKDFPSIREYQQKITQIAIAEMQIRKKNDYDLIYVINTSIFFLIDYFGQLFYKQISQKR